MLLNLGNWGEVGSALTVFQSLREAWLKHFSLSGLLGHSLKD